jgi:hypothetical protein
LLVRFDSVRREGPASFFKPDLAVAHAHIQSEFQLVLPVGIPLRLARLRPQVHGSGRSGVRELAPAGRTNSRQPAETTAAAMAAAAICLFMKFSIDVSAKAPLPSKTGQRQEEGTSGTALRMRRRENQHASVLADREVTRVASRLATDNRWSGFSGTHLRMCRACAPRRTASKGCSAWEVTFEEKEPPLTRRVIREECSRDASPTCHRPARHA